MLATIIFTTLILYYHVSKPTVTLQVPKNNSTNMKVTHPHYVEFSCTALHDLSYPKS